MQTLDVGEIAVITTTWFDGNGDAAEPSAITLTITKPDGTQIVKTKADMTQGATSNVWMWQQSVDLPGAWLYTPEGVVAGLPVIQPQQVFLVGDGSATTAGPCEPWATWAEVTECVSQDLSSLNEAQRESAIDTASQILYDLSGRFYPGICSTTRDLCIGCLTCGLVHCSCWPREMIDLGMRSPVWAVWSVTVDGVALVQGTDYTVVDRRYLARLGDGLSWPRSTDLTDPTAFRATWAFGRPVPPGGRRAAALFAAEIAKSCAGLQCALPARVTTVVREGVTFTILDSQKFLDEGRTGIYLVDAWLTADAKGRRAKPGIFIPGGSAVRSTPR